MLIYKKLFAEICRWFYEYQLRLYPTLILLAHYIWMSPVDMLNILNELTAVWTIPTGVRLCWWSVCWCMGGLNQAVQQSFKLGLRVFFIVPGYFRISMWIMPGYLRGCQWVSFLSPHCLSEIVVNFRSCKYGFVTLKCEPSHHIDLVYSIDRHCSSYSLKFPNCKRARYCTVSSIEPIFSRKTWGYFSVTNWGN